MSFLAFLGLIGSELFDLFTHYQGPPDDAKAEQIAMRIARRVSDEMAKKEIAGP